MTNFIIIYVILFLVVISTVIFLVIYNSKRNVIIRKLKKTSSKRIALVKENEYVKIIGKAQAIDKPLISSIGKRSCVYYHIKVEEERKGRKSKSWHTIIEETKSTNFIIESSGEKAIVNANTGLQNKMVYLVKDIKHRSGTWNDPSEFLEDYLQSYGKKSTGHFGFNKTMRYQEGIIEIGENIAVLGTGNWKESDHKFDRYSSQNLFISGDKANKLLITDDPKTLGSE